MSPYDTEALETAFPRFANFRRLGQGGEGAVLSVWDRIRKSDLALKLMRDSGEPDLADRFEREYAILASSRSERLVRVHDHGQELIPVRGAPYNHYWYTMELCESSVRSTHRRMPLARRVDVVLQMLDGLAFLHAKDIAHRDIKPDNIFVRADGRPVLIDFGAARQAIGGATQSLTSVLTPGFAPLEQYSADGKQGPWTDLYAMGGVLYRAVVDRNPPDAVTRVRGDALATGVGAGLAGALGRYSEPFLHAIEWALELEEKKRPQSVPEWKKRLFAARAIEPGNTAKTILARSPGKPRRRRWPYIAGITLLAVAAGNLVHKQRAERHEEQVKMEAPGPAEELNTEKSQRFRQEALAEFRAADTNGDGHLSREECARYPALAQHFQAADRDGDGRISQREFIQAKRATLERRLGKPGP